ncbi:MAG: type II toxin-antitoxin system CcdA family antitoxin [Firmicutes bacterium]|nr:type II toxin-antitoxin system CcdA family antitoxin [Bacillota bacterium]
MSTTYEDDGPKRPVNLTLNANLVRLGKEMGLNLSAVAEEAIAYAYKTKLTEAWLRDNETAIQGYNRRVEARGVFSDGLRSF